MIYDSLPASSIRLLRIHEDETSDYAGELEVTDLNHLPPYYTLSYCWGTDPQSIPLQVGKGTIYINTNLAQGIRRLKELAGCKSKGPIQIKYIWIDKICINQSDIFERSSQVCLMGEIYSRSIRTLVWLGAETTSEHDAWPLLDQIYRVFREQNPEARTLADIPLRLYSDERHVALGLPDLNNKQWKHLDTLLRIPWFTRIWVVQEVVLSSQDPIVLYGQHLHPWEPLGWAASWMRRNGYFRLPGMPEALRNIEEMSNIRRSQVRWPLDVLLTTTSVKFRATDQRDKVYGLIGIAAESQDLSNIPTALQPNYSLTVKQVYIRTARFLLQKHRSLAIMIRTRHAVAIPGYNEHSSNLSCLPSWIPDWSDFKVFDREITKSFSWISYSRCGQPADLGYPKHYRASGGRPAEIARSTSEDILRISGMRLNTVLQVSRFNDTGHTYGSFREEFKSITLRMLESMTPLMLSKGLVTWVTQYIKTTTAEQYFLGGVKLDQMLRDGAAYIYDSLLSHDAILKSVSRSDDADAMASLKHLSLGGNGGRYMALAQNFCFGRSLIITSSKAMGLGPASSSSGDLVCVLHGGGVPYILRPCGCAWELIGDSYFPEAMNAETILAERHRTLMEEIFDLR
ncbi:HET domain-containing protein [Xylariaceae sp. FL0255]|nr:HET domain-containing protein [Xylariaceae sp. FL0255]